MADTIEEFLALIAAFEAAERRAQPTIPAAMARALEVLTRRD